MIKDKTSDKRKIKNKRWRWVLKIMSLSFIISMVFSYVSSGILESVNNSIAFLVLFIFISIGIVFDTIGVAATSCEERQFHSMAAKKVKGAKEAVWLIHNAEKVASICNDVVGDISGIISGATGAIIIARITTSNSSAISMVIQLAITGLIASLTIGGKAAGKGLGISNSAEILFAVGKVIDFVPFIDLNKK